MHETENMVPFPSPKGVNNIRALVHELELDRCRKWHEMASYEDI